MSTRNTLDSRSSPAQHVSNRIKLLSETPREPWGSVNETKRKTASRDTETIGERTALCFWYVFAIMFSFREFRRYCLSPSSRQRVILSTRIEYINMIVSFLSRWGYVSCVPNACQNRCFVRSAKLNRNEYNNRYCRTSTTFDAGAVRNKIFVSNHVICTSSPTSTRSIDAISSSTS